MSPSKDETPVSKIAIKGFSLTSKSAKGAPKSKPNSTLGKRPRSSFAADNSGSDDDDGGFRNGDSNGRAVTHEIVTGFGSSGAIRQAEEKKEEVLVIPRMANRDWRAETRAKKGKNLLPQEVQDANAERERVKNGEAKIEGVDVVNSADGEIAWGLSVRKRVKVDYESAESEDTTPKEELVRNDGKDLRHGTAGQETAEETKLSVDDEALQALLGNGLEKKKGPDLIIPVAVEDEDTAGPISEQDAYKRAIQAAPDVSTLEDYERVPVEEFGAALLRGMGWKGEKRASVKDIKRRQNLLGLGAKELKDAEELGAWVQKSDIKRLNAAGGDRRDDRRPKASEYKRDKERRDERREERGGGSYRRERERERDGYRDGRDYRNRDRDRDRRR
jgi:hypothetical protein